MVIDEKEIQRYINEYTTCEGIGNLTIEQLRTIAVTSIALTHDVQRAFDESSLAFQPFIEKNK